MYYINQNCQDGTLLFAQVVVTVIQYSKKNTYHKKNHLFISI